MRIEFQITAAVILDLLFGDPRWLPHPVRFIGGFAAMIERPLRRWVKHERTAGIFAALLVICTTAAVAWGLVAGAALIHPWCAGGVSVFLLYTCFATRDLVSHADRVREALDANNLPEARSRVAMLVGRDTAALDEPEIVRATVESVAENMVDGVTAPMFFAALGGPVGALAYKAASTLDSTFGYKNDRYLRFGWASARLDDVANYLPARITTPLIALAAGLLGMRAHQSWAIRMRDGRKHPSPNSGLSEAAVAGALGVQLGGVNFYGGVRSERARLGDPVAPLCREQITKTNRLMMLGSLLALALFLAVRWQLTRWFA